ncbi:MAG: hypothetical protein ACD_60C00068G0012 [uncultured bacterium]|nr:MAG: hypothetical protein ACD_60C00068G0012 [uncultured bacterium]
MILPVARMGHPILQQVAEKVKEVNAPSVQTFLSNFIETFHALDGVGLAASQVFQPWRIVIFHLSSERAKLRGHHEEIPLTILINPVIEFLTDEVETAWEACFSLPGLMGQVSRCKAIRYSGLTPDGDTISREVEGYHARMVQHECDHLDGILYPMRMHDMSRFGFMEEIRQIPPK